MVLSVGTKLYGAPAGIEDDFNRRPLIKEQLKHGWHKRVTNFINQTKSPSATPSELFYDQLADTSGIPDSAPVGIPWNAFPLLLTRWFADKPAAQAERLANEAAEKLVRLASFGLFRKTDSGKFEPLVLPYRRQDEYCEWYVERHGDKIKRICITAEPPEYWEFLAEQDFSLVVDLYRELLGVESIQPEELQWQHDVYEPDEDGAPIIAYKKGSYCRWNVWNTEKGAVHLTHWANTLGAEIRLASDGTLGWPIELSPGQSPDPQGLICCSGYGSVNRSSDPIIGAAVFNFARQGNSVALVDPIGLYMQSIAVSISDPDGNNVTDDCVKRIRKSQDGSKILRVEVAPSEEATYSLDECTIDGDPVAFGGQITRNITMSLFGCAKKIPAKKITPIDECQVFCCQYPSNEEFYGIFGAEPGRDCGNITESDWARSLRDIPIGAAAAATAGEIQIDARYKPLGRALIPAPEIKTE